MFGFACTGGEWLTICLRNAIREFAGGLRSSLLSFPSAGAGVASASSLRSTVCKAESTSWDLLTSTGDSHTTWIILPCHKTVEKTLPQPCLIKQGPGCPSSARWLQVRVYDHFKREHSCSQGALTTAAKQTAGAKPSSRKGQA